LAVVQSLGALRRLTGPDRSSAWYPVSTSPEIPAAYRGDYAALYRAQPAVRVSVEFLARNIAQLGLHVFRRLANDSRERVRDGLATLLDWPNPSTSRFRLMSGTVSDLGIWGNAYWLKLGGAGNIKGLVRLHPRTVEAVGGLLPTRYDWTTTTDGIWSFAPSDLVHFRWYDPETELRGVSPLETLRRTLAEERAAGDHRLGMWRNGARIGGWIGRPKEAGTWSDPARERFRQQWNAKYAGPGNAGGVPVLEDGMAFHEATYSPKDTEYVTVRKLNREEVATVYQIPLPFVGILDHATFSNIREQHKHLYMDCLGPILEMIVSELELHLLRDFPDADAQYLEFNIAAKLAGSFEEQATAIQKLTGGPVMTRDEGRARLNLPAQGGDAAKLLTPLNTTTRAAVADDGAVADLEALDARLDLVEASTAHAERVALEAIGAVRQGDAS
jgi:HK97 family phage portal protein